MPEGILVVNKPRGLTSHDVVNRVRRIRNQALECGIDILNPVQTSAAGMDPAVAESLKPRIEQALELLTLAEQPAAIEHADRIAQLLLGKIEPNTGLVEARLARLNTVRAILEQGEWLTAEQLNALQPDPPAQKAGNCEAHGKTSGDHQSRCASGRKPLGI